MLYASSSFYFRIMINAHRNNEPVPLRVLPSFSVYVETKLGSRFVQ